MAALTQHDAYDKVREITAAFEASGEAGLNTKGVDLRLVWHDLCKVVDAHRKPVADFLALLDDGQDTSAHMHRLVVIFNSKMTTARSYADGDKIRSVYTLHEELERLAGTLRESIATPEDLYAQPACCPADIHSADPAQAAETTPLLPIRAQPRPMGGMTSLLGRLAVDTRTASATIANVATEVSSSAVQLRAGAEEPLATFCTALGKQDIGRVLHEGGRLADQMAALQKDTRGSLAQLMALHTDVIPEHVSPEHIRDLCVTLHGVQDAVTKAQAGLEHARQAVSEDAETRRILEALEFEVLAGMTYSQWANVKLQLDVVPRCTLHVSESMREALIPGGCWGCIALPSPVMYSSIEQADMLRQRADVDHVKDEIARLSDSCRRIGQDLHAVREARNLFPVSLKKAMLGCKAAARSVESLDQAVLRALLEYAQRLNSPEPRSTPTPPPPSTPGAKTSKRPTAKAVLYF